MQENDCSLKKCIYIYLHIADTDERNLVTSYTLDNIFNWILEMVYLVINV